MASIYKRGKVWTANVFILHDGVRKRKTKSGFTTKSEANKWAIETENKKINNAISREDGLIVDMFNDWYKVFKEPHLETKSKTWYKTTSAVLSEHWPDKKLSEINSMMFQKLINEYGSNHVKSSVAHIKNMISAFVRYAVDEDFIFKDFTRNVKTYSIVESKDKNLKFLENDELEYLTDAVKTNDALTSHMILTAIFSGARFSEVAGLTEDDFDFNNNTITINKSWQENDREFKSTKTKSSNRVVDMPKDYMSIAKKWQFGKEHAFESITGLPPTNNAANKQLERILKNGNCKIITFHGLRHTHASYLLANDVAIQYVSERLGHSDVNITLSVYAHLLKKKRHIETNKTIKLLSNL
ncbi:site-specific integrase [Leuconostoc gelidum subsp. gasicomitatum]|uniref:site-specific integrase n=1 Tax=Leuconostoc gasicomitatum TaxID=115778 RepID=UPI001CC45611|nr:site-specific integrase [Leuconostoc gasicomitatum]MBZ5995399.1 site-specific integrase [Leuconostoc gasicomitatum]